MRQAVLDVGSNTAHLLVVDAYRGAPPLPASSMKKPLRLAEHITQGGALSDEGVDALVGFIREALTEAEDQRLRGGNGLRDLGNSRGHQQRRGARARPGTNRVELAVLDGADEARLTFLAVRRWFGWSSGRLAVFDIGGGSLEIAAGNDERPDVAQSFELGAGRLSRQWLPADDVPSAEAVRAMRKYVRAEIARDAGPLLRGGVGDHTVATSKTFRSLARVCGAASSEGGPHVRRVMRRNDLKGWLPKIAVMSNVERAALPGVSGATGAPDWWPAASSPKP